MKVRIQEGKVGMLPGTREAILERIHFALARLNHRIQTLQVRLDDRNGPKGGVDKRCVMEAVLVQRGSLVVEISDEDILTAVTRVAQRLARRVADEFERSRDLRRLGPRPRTHGRLGDPSTEAG
ncbi:MAG: hypothetical protein NTV86_09930 [Planctomycetota bacterium]|nr:hypothetical protein [Planctomycetota bacterium]